MKKAYVIRQSNPLAGWSNVLEPTHVALTRKQAKATLRKIIFESREKHLFEIKENRWYKHSKRELENYISRLTDENRKPYSCCSDFCQWIHVWCDIVELVEDESEGGKQ